MLKVILFLFLLCGSLQAKDLDVQIQTRTTGTTIAAGARRIVFILDSGVTMFHGGLQNGVTSVDNPYVLNAPKGDTLSSVTFSVSSPGTNSVRVIVMR